MARFLSYAPIEGTANNVDPYNYIGDGHVLVYQEAGCGNPASLWELFEGEAIDGGWLDVSNALWSNVGSNNLTPQGMGTADAAGFRSRRSSLTPTKLLAQAHSSSPNGTSAASHQIHPQPHVELLGLACYRDGRRRELHGYGREFNSRGISISQSSSPVSCTWSAPAGEIYRLMASVPNPLVQARVPNRQSSSQRFETTESSWLTTEAVGA